jgi:hypothetical protein
MDAKLPRRNLTTASVRSVDKLIVTANSTDTLTELLSKRQRTHCEYISESYEQLNFISDFTEQIRIEAARSKKAVSHAVCKLKASTNQLIDERNKLAERKWHNPEPKYQTSMLAEEFVETFDWRSASICELLFNAALRLNKHDYAMKADIKQSISLPARRLIQAHFEVEDPNFALSRDANESGTFKHAGQLEILSATVNLP